MTLLFAIVFFAVYVFVAIAWLKQCATWKFKHESKIDSFLKEFGVFAVEMCGLVMIYMAIAYYPIQRFLESLS